MHLILEALFRQHRDAEVMLADFSAVNGRVKSGATKQADVMTELSRLRREIRGEVLSHFREEELALFPVLGRHVDASSGLIAVLIEVHPQFRQLELEFEEALAAIESGDEDGWQLNLPPEALPPAGDERQLRGRSVVRR